MSAPYIFRAGGGIQTEQVAPESWQAVKARLCTKPMSALWEVVCLDLSLRFYWRAQEARFVL